MNPEVMNPNKVTFVTVVAILEHVTPTLAEPRTLLDGHGEHWMVRVGGGEVFFECDEFHFFSFVVVAPIIHNYRLLSTPRAVYFRILSKFLLARYLL